MPEPRAELTCACHRTGLADAFSTGHCYSCEGGETEFEPTEAELERMNDPERSGPRDEDPEYRSAMSDAGRGGSLR